MFRAKILWIAVGAGAVLCGMVVIFACVLTFSTLMDVADEGKNVSGHGAYTFLSRFLFAIFIVVIGVVIAANSSALSRPGKGLLRRKLVLTLLIALAAAGILSVCVLDIFLEYTQKPLLPAFNSAMVPLQVVSTTVALCLLIPLVAVIIRNRR